MPTSVQVGGDTVTFPDGMSDADMKAALDKEYGGANNTVPNDPAPAQLRPDEGLGVAYGLKHPADNMGVWLDKVPALRAVDEFMARHSEGLLTTADKAAAATNADVAAAAKQGRKPGFAGKVLGNTVSALPILAATKNPWLTGAMMGATDTSDPNSAAGTAVDAGIGSVSGGVGQKLLGMASAAIKPRLNALVQKLLDEGVQLTPGQTLGGMAHRLEDATRSIYGLGDMVIGAQANAQKSLNRVAVQRTLSPLGIQIPKDMPEGHAQIGFAQTTLSDAYSKVLSSIDHTTAPTGSTLPVVPGGGPRPGLHIDNQFGQDVSTLRQMAKSMPPDQAHVFESFVQGDVRHAFDQTGAISGDAMKKLDETIGLKVKNFMKGGPHDRDLAQSLKELQANLRDMVGRQFPQHKATLDAINSGYAQLAKLEPAAANAAGGVVTAPALRAATVAGDTTTRHRASARGEAMMQDLGDAADRVMRNTIPDSGTPARALASAGAGYALFGNPMHGLHVNPWAASALGALSLPYSGKTAGAVTRAAISSRPAGAKAIRAAIDRVLPVGAVAGTNLGLDQEPK